MIEIDNFPCVPGRWEGRSGLLSTCVSGLFDVRLEKCYKSSFTSLTPCWSLLSKYLYAHTEEALVHLYWCFVISWEWVFSARLQPVYLRQLLWTKKATLILSRLVFSLFWFHRFSLTHSHTCVHRQGEVYAQAIWSGSLGMAQWMRNTRYQVFDWVPCSPYWGYLLVSSFLVRSCTLSRILL